MGLFSCMRPSLGQRQGIRYSKKDITKPLVCTLSLHHKHLDRSTLQHDVPITRTDIHRWYLAANVERIVIRQGNIRGSLLKPKGQYLIKTKSMLYFFQLSFFQLNTFHNFNAL